MKDKENLDGGKGSGRYPKGSGNDEPLDNHGEKSEKKTLSPKTRAKYDKALIGVKTSDGVVIKGSREHAYDRCAERGITETAIKRVLTTGLVSEGKTVDGEKRNEYKDPKTKVIVAIGAGEIVTVIDPRSTKKKGRKK